MNTSSHTLAWAHPLVRTWFLNRFENSSEPQRLGWSSILAGQATLISAPTGSGKTFAAFLVCLDKLIRQAIDGKLANHTSVIYVSPLKALSNDVQKNLLLPLKEIQMLAEEEGIKLDEIRVALRTGDTKTTERQMMLRKPPHILVTTPESIYLLLTAEKSRVFLQQTTTVIVDEIHALANNKRGSHLALSLERLDALTEQKPLRIGLSATQHPIQLVADFLTGQGHEPAHIVNIGHIRTLDLAIEVPKTELAPITANEVWDEIYERIAELSSEHRSTLVFVNTRKMAERIAHHLAERVGNEYVTTHHGSLSRKLRLDAETRLKNGELKILVATASLELGIDIGTIDLVCQIGSPRAISIALQRVGRAGHWYGAIPKARFFATTRDELVDCAALVQAIEKGDLDRLIMPEEPLDILAQQMVATCATNDWHESELFELIKRSYPYRHLSWATFKNLVSMLSDGIAGSRGRYGAYLFYDQVNGILKARRGSRMLAITNGGAIPENNVFTVKAEPNANLVGTLDEDFAIESHRGDIILLGNTSWQITKIESSKGLITVSDAHGAPPSVPFWLGEAPGRTNELSEQVSQLRKIIGQLITENRQEEAREWLVKTCRLSDYAADQLINYLAEGIAVLGVVPTQETIVAERFFDEGGGMQLIIHSPFGSRINKAWGLALRKRFCRSFNFELQAAATDDGIAIALAEQHSFPLADVFHFLNPKTLIHVLTQAILQSPVFKTRWRWDATRALALPRFRHGRKVPPTIQRMLADDLLAAVFPDAAACQDNLGGRDIELPAHPLIDETMKDCLHEAMDVDGLLAVLKDMRAGKITCVAVDTPTPSAFSHEILNANPYAFLDDAPLEERRSRAVSMRRILPESMLQNVAQLDMEAIKAVQQQSWPDLRSEDELHDFLQTVIVLPEQRTLGEWVIFFNTLMQTGRAGRARLQDDKMIWFAAEKREVVSAIYEKAEFLAPIPKQIHADINDPLIQLLRGWLQHLGPTTAAELAKTFSLPVNELENALLQLEATGAILRGFFRTPSDNLEWCDRRLLARIHRLTIARLRREIEPVSAEAFQHWLEGWQHITPGTQLRGEQGLAEIIKQMQGYELAANTWEKEIFAKRVSDYQPELLDHLCFTGQVGWGRLSPHPALLTDSSKSIRPTSVAPITFFWRENAAALTTNAISSHLNENPLSDVAQRVYEYLKENGASFFIDIVSDLGRVKAEVEMALWELVAAGFLTADSFDNLRALIDPRRRTRRRGHYRQTSGRWFILKRNASLKLEQRLEAMAWILLKRYGVCFRDLLIKEKTIAPWRELLPIFRLLEARGEIRGGHFVGGYIGEQFALPYAVESLRAARSLVLG